MNNLERSTRLDLLRNLYCECHTEMLYAMRALSNYLEEYPDFEKARTGERHSEYEMKQDALEGRVRTLLGAHAIRCDHLRMELERIK